MQYDLLSTVIKDQILNESFVSDDEFERIKDPRNVTGLHPHHHETYKQAIKDLNRNNRNHNNIMRKILAGD